MSVLPAPPAALTGPPRAFYEELRALVQATGPTQIDELNVETDFGDAGVAVTLPHIHEPDWTLTAQCSRRAVVVFAGPVSEHFDERDEGWTSAAVAFMGDVLGGERELKLPTGRRGRRRSEPGGRLRIDFGARSQV